MTPEEQAALDWYGNLIITEVLPCPVCGARRGPPVLVGPEAQAVARAARRGAGAVKPTTGAGAQGRMSRCC